VVAAAQFDEYLVVDWSARSTPSTGRDTVWVAHGQRVGARLDLSTENPPTRAEGMDRVAAILDRALRSGRRVLLGFDFSFGYPAGFAEVTAGLTSAGRPPWRRTWELLAARVEDRPDNTNNRFEAADKLNEATGTRLFWGRPRGRLDGLRSLSATTEVPAHLRPNPSAALRRAEQAAGRGIRSSWQLYGRCSVGGQTLVGLPALRALVDGRPEALAVWPFDTGFSPEPAFRGRPAPVVVAEVWPSAFSADPGGSVRDEGQVLGTVRAIADRDARGLGGWFDPPTVAALKPEGRLAVEAEEGWILGVT